MTIACQMTLAASNALMIPRGTDILVRTDDTIDSRKADEDRVYPATVDQDIFDERGGVLVRKGTRAELLVREVDRGKDLVLDLQSILIGGPRYFRQYG